MLASGERHIVEKLHEMYMQFGKIFYKKVLIFFTRRGIMLNVSRGVAQLG